MRRGLKVLLRIFLVLFVVAGVLGIVIWQSKIETITITGNEFYKDQEIKDILFDGKLGQNTIFCYLENKFGEHKTIPFVERYQIEIKNQHEIEVVIYEKNIIGYVDYMGGYMYFDRDGVVVESSSEKKKNIVEIRGISFSNIVLNEPMELASDMDSDSLFDDILLMTQMFEKYSLKIDTIIFTESKIKLDESTKTVRTASVKVNDITVDLGSSEYIDQKIAQMADILPELKGLKGTLHLDSVTTIGADDGVYYFTVEE